MAMIFMEARNSFISSLRFFFEEYGAKQKEIWREINFLEYSGFRTQALSTSKVCHSLGLKMDIIRYKVSSQKNVNRRCR